VIKGNKKMAASTTAQKLWNKLNGTSLGRWLFAKIICFKAPYFDSVSPRISVLQQNLCEGYFNHKRKVQNHIGTVHAIALCNIAELCAGLMVDVSIPADMRWIPQSMTVNYLKKAKGKMHAKAEPIDPLISNAEGYQGKTKVTISDSDNVAVFTAEITMWISPRK
jgi:acyl-coenzyme A thioesterase PaaI-like protein